MIIIEVIIITENQMLTFVWFLALELILSLKLDD
jgi:hypothetical protein